MDWATAIMRSKSRSLLSGVGGIELGVPNASRTYCAAYWMKLAAPQSAAKSAS